MPKKLAFEMIAFEDVPLAARIPDSAPPRPVVLVVDDEQIIADTRSAIFTGWGYTCLTAYDPEAALALARVIPPELLVCDIFLTGMNGVDLAIEMKKIVPDCNVLLISGFVGGVEMFNAARHAGHEFTFLAKPVHPVELHAHALKLSVRVQVEPRLQTAFDLAPWQIA